MAAPNGGYIPDGFNADDPKYMFKGKPAAPTSVNLLKATPAAFKPPPPIGSCVVDAVAAAVSYLTHQTNDSKIPASPSRRFISYNAGAIPIMDETVDNTPWSGVVTDNGVQLRQALRAVSSFGAVPEDSFPWTGHDGINTHPFKDIYMEVDNTPALEYCRLDYETVYDEKAGTELSSQVKKPMDHTQPREANLSPRSEKTRDEALDIQRLGTGPMKMEPNSNIAIVPRGGNIEDVFWVSQERRGFCTHFVANRCQSVTYVSNPGTATRRVAAVSTSPDSLEVFSIGTEGYVLLSRCRVNGDATPVNWEYDRVASEGLAFPGANIVVSHEDNSDETWRIHVYWVGPQGSGECAEKLNNNTPPGWGHHRMASLGSTSPSGHLTALTTGPILGTRDNRHWRQRLWCIVPDGRLYHLRYLYRYKPFQDLPVRHWEHYKTAPNTAAPPSTVSPVRLPGAQLHQFVKMFYGSPQGSMRVATEGYKDPPAPMDELAQLSYAVGSENDIVAFYDSVNGKAWVLWLSPENVFMAGDG
ncbi:Fc.00g107050.m01.CDS01 [Cosmosporella sp. VM-42]